MIQNIVHNNQILAILIMAEFDEAGIHFCTPDNFSQQLAYMKHPQGKSIVPHRHNQIRREAFHTQEVLVIKKGKLRVDFYTENQEYLESRILKTGDTILLNQGGHGFEVLEEVEMIEVKQGPFLGNRDKTRFSSIDADQVKIVEPR
ncbi:MAG: hypothetical protein F6K41_17395 [Symploca sp. SIO3E6]|nr:hypothetical protein [Caldora sp. SIO3E6]